MARVKISYTNIVNKAMHRPVVTVPNGSYPLYAKVDGATQSEGVATLAEQEAKYVEACKHTFNSPTNIRRLFITGKRVLVQYYTPFVIKGKKSETYSVSTTYKMPNGCEVSNLIEVAEQIVFERESMERYRRGEIPAPETNGATTYSVQGNSFNVLSNNYACNNIEEVYFDWTSLLADNVAPYLQGFDFYSHIAEWTQGPGVGVQKNNIVYDLLVQFNASGNKETFLKRFPRLKIAGIISNLDAIITNEAMRPVNGILKENANKTWFEENIELIKAARPTALISTIRNSTKPITEFNIKDQQYKFDQAILKATVAEYLNKLKEEARAVTQTAHTSSKDEVDEEAYVDTSHDIAQDLDSYITELYAHGKERGIQPNIVVRIAARGLTKSERKEIVSSLSPENRKIVGKILIPPSARS